MMRVLVEFWLIVGRVQGGEDWKEREGNMNYSIIPRSFIKPRHGNSRFVSQFLARVPTLAAQKPGADTPFPRLAVPLGY